MRASGQMPPNRSRTRQGERPGLRASSERARARIVVLVMAVVLLAVYALSAGSARSDLEVSRRTVPVAATVPVKPNIILILSDDQRSDTLLQMPYVRKLLGKHGMTFTNAFVSSSICCPSRASILTGRYAHNTGVVDNQPPEGGVASFHPASTVATWLQGGGYRTSLIGKYLNGYSGTAIPPGWTDWHAFGGSEGSQVYYDYTLSENGTLVTYGSTPADYQTTVLFSRAKTFIKASRKPFFLYLAPSAPHTPATPAPEDVGRFSGIAPYRPLSYNEVDTSDKPWDGIYAPLTQTNMDNIDAYRQNALATLQALDRGVSDLVALLTTRGELDNTIIIFTSDNGFMLGEHRMAEKQWAYEPSIRVPMVFRLPWSLIGRTDTHLVMNIDLASTIATLAGVKPGLKQNGMDMVPLLLSEGAPVPWRDEIYLEFRATTPAPRRPPPYRGVRTTLWKYIEYDNGWRELYDLTSDPEELQNRANDPAYAAIRSALSAEIAALSAT